MARRTGANNAIRRDNEKKQRRNRKCLESNLRSLSNPAVQLESRVVTASNH